MTDYRTQRRAPCQYNVYTNYSTTFLDTFQYQALDVQHNKEHPKLKIPSSCYLTTVYLMASCLYSGQELRHMNYSKNIVLNDFKLVELLHLQCP